MSTGLRERREIAEDPGGETLWLNDLDVLEDDGVDKARGHSRVPGEAIHRLASKLVLELIDKGRIEQARVVGQAFRAEVDWTRVHIHGEGPHRYGYLPPGSVLPAGEDPTPVDRPDTWDF